MSTHRWGAALLAGLALACSGILGVDDERESAVSQLCKCEDVAGSSSALFDSVGACQVELSARLDGARTQVRATWLATFQKDGCKNCATHETCLKAPPICRPKDASCSQDLQCCNTCDQGTCT